MSYKWEKIFKQVDFNFFSTDSRIQSFDSETNYSQISSYVNNYSLSAPYSYKFEWIINNETIEFIWQQNKNFEITSYDDTSIHPINIIKDVSGDTALFGGLRQSHSKWTNYCYYNGHPNENTFYFCVGQKTQSFGGDDANKIPGYYGNNGTRKATEVTLFVNIPHTLSIDYFNFNSLIQINSNNYSDEILITFSNDVIE